MNFKTDFNFLDYKGILPKLPDDDSEIINCEIDNELDQFWKKQPFPHIITPDFLYREAVRIKQGVWIFIKGNLIWIPGNYYFFLQYWNATGRPPQFRLKRLKRVYEKIWVRNTPSYIGTFVYKNRKDGETLFSVSDIMWEVAIDEQRHGTFAMQSKTNDTVKGSCWKSLTSGWMGIKPFFKDYFFSDFASGNNISEQFKFIRSANPDDPDDMGKNLNIVMGTSTYNTFDAYSDIFRMVLDEVAKWKECHFYASFINYGQFIMPGIERRGLFDIMTSPADENGWWNDEAEIVWKMCNEMDPDTGSTKSRLLPVYSNPLDGIEGMYDKYGDCDPQQVLEHIMRKRRALPKDKLMPEIRAYPLPIIGTNKPNPEELFGSTDTASIWINKTGITRQYAFVKSEKEKMVQYGNWEWPNNVEDSGEPLWRPADVMEFNNENARWCRSFTQLPKVDLPNMRKPPHISLIEHSLGGDPFNLRYGTKNAVTGSMGAGVVWRCRDLSLSGVLDCPIEAYLARPWHQSIYHEDMILSCVANRAMFQYENKTTDLEKFFEDRGYLDWMLVGINSKPMDTPDGIKLKRGDGPEGRGANAFLNMMINLINGVTNLPLTQLEKYLLENFKIEEILEDLLNFNKDQTQQNHLTIALGQALIGRVKILFKKIKQKLSVNNEMVAYFDF